MMHRGLAVYEPMPVLLQEIRDFSDYEVEMGLGIVRAGGPCVLLYHLASRAKTGINLQSSAIFFQTPSRISEQYSEPVAEIIG